MQKQPWKLNYVYDACKTHTMSKKIGTDVNYCGQNEKLK